MDPRRYIIIFLLILSWSCIPEKPLPAYKGPIDPGSHHWLKDKKIFIDPGHGGAGQKDSFRMGPGGITEEALNLHVSLVLYDMLKRAGALTKISRLKDQEVSLDERVDMVNEYKPDVFISVHHNGTARRADNVNYPCVFIWGNRENRPASYDLAVILLNELENLMGIKGQVLSDFSVFSETGTRVLRKTRYSCPGILGEGGFFSDSAYAEKLRDPDFLQMEAEAYFKAISSWFKKGTPSAEVTVSVPFKNTDILYRCLTSNRPSIRIRCNSGDDNNDILSSSLMVTLDGLPVKHKKLDNGLYRVLYGPALLPGGHRLRFSFRNKSGNSSMVFKACFTCSIKKGDYKKLKKTGMLKIRQAKTRGMGVRMLITAYRLSPTDPEAGDLVYHISSALKKMGMPDLAAYYGARLRHFYPQNSRNRQKKHGSIEPGACFFPVDYYGRPVDLLYEP